MEDKKIGDLFKKVISTGLGAAFMTEDAIKGALEGLPIPKDTLNGLLSFAKNSKDDFMTSLKEEVKNYLNKFDVSKEVDRVLENYDIEITANIKFKPKAAKKSKAVRKKKST